MHAPECSRSGKWRDVYVNGTVAFAWLARMARQYELAQRIRPTARRARGKDGSPADDVTPDLPGDPRGGTQGDPRAVRLGPEPCQDRLEESRGGQGALDDDQKMSATAISIMDKPGRAQDVGRGQGHAACRRGRRPVRRRGDVAARGRAQRAEPTAPSSQDDPHRSRPAPRCLQSGSRGAEQLHDRHLVSAGRRGCSELPARSWTTVARQTTSMLMRSTARLVNAIDADAMDVAITSSSDEPMPSANLCDALLRMKPGDPRGALELSCTWASALPPVDRAHVPSQVQLRHAHFAAIEEIYEKLRSSSTPRESLFVVAVDTLDGASGDDGRMRGEVILSVLQERNLKAHVDLDADEYVTALEAHRDRALVKLWGVLHRGTRVHRITDVSGFGRVDR